MKISKKKAQCLLIIILCFFYKSSAIPGREFGHKRSNAILLATIEQWGRGITPVDERKKVANLDFPSFPSKELFKSEELFEDPPFPTPPNSPREGRRCVRFADDIFLHGTLLKEIQRIVEERKELGETR